MLSTAVSMPALARSVRALHRRGICPLAARREGAIAQPGLILVGENSTSRRSSVGSLVLPRLHDPAVAAAAPGPAVFHRVQPANCADVQCLCGHNEPLTQPTGGSRDAHGSRSGEYDSPHG